MIDIVRVWLKMSWFQINEKNHSENDGVSKISPTLINLTDDKVQSNITTLWCAPPNTSTYRVMPSQHVKDLFQSWKIGVVDRPSRLQ